MSALEAACQLLILACQSELIRRLSLGRLDIAVSTADGIDLFVGPHGELAGTNLQICLSLAQALLVFVR